MKLPARGRMRYVLTLTFTLVCLSAVVAALGVPSTRAWAQNLRGPESNPVGGGVFISPLASDGAYGIVIFANARWMVVQNQDGQQYPIAADPNTEFLVRWPASVGDLLAPGTLAEGVGEDLGGRAMQTDHLDLFVKPDPARI